MTSSSEVSHTMIVYRCKECGKKSLSLGYIHGHAEKHNGWGPFNLLINPFRAGSPDALDEFIEELHVESFRVVDRAE